MKLNDSKCKNLKPRDEVYKVADGNGLSMEIRPNGSKYWRFSYRYNGKQKGLALGVYPRVSLRDAREKREEARKQLDLGNDPSVVKKLFKLEIQQKYADNFEAIAREWHKNSIQRWKPLHGANILKRLEANIFPVFGYRPIKEVTLPEILAALRKVEAKENYELAHRLLQTCSQIFRYATATGRAARDITPDLKGALIPVKSKHHAYLDETQLPGFLKELELYDSPKYNGYRLTTLAFKLLILTFVRSVEIRAAKWDEFDFEKAQWKIPAKRMKMGSPHIVPLSKQSLEILKEAKLISGDSYSNYVFPSNATPLNCMSENTFLRAIEIMGYKGKTVGHGFRATASTILNENRFHRDVIERQLAHCERDQVRAAYNYADYIPERVKMMQWWADYLDTALEK